MTQTSTTRTRTTFRAGDRVTVVKVAHVHPHFAGETGTVWCADRTGAVVTLDSRGVADTRFTLAELASV